MVKVYLVQHGQAEEEAKDPERSLTALGAAEAERVAGHLAKCGIRVSAIFHSGKKRARQTAEIISKGIKVDVVAAAEGLGPLDDPRVWAEKLSTTDRDVMLVGHLPHLSRLASLLLVGDEKGELIAFKYAAVLCLERSGARWTVRWYLTPDLLA